MSTPTKPYKRGTKPKIDSQNLIAHICIKNVSPTGKEVKETWSTSSLPFALYQRHTKYTEVRKEQRFCGALLYFHVVAL